MFTEKRMIKYVLFDTYSWQLSLRGVSLRAIDKTETQDEIYRFNKLNFYTNFDRKPVILNQLSGQMN